MYRKEKDSLGEIKVPLNAYYGPQTQRAINNFPISGLRLQNIFIKAQAIIKLAAAKTNISLKYLDKKIGNAIIKASKEILNEKLLENFVVDVYQAGAGTSQNMNINEIITNRALELIDKPKGFYNIIHPNDHVNMGQSTNDTIPTAIQISSMQASLDLKEELKLLRDELKKKSIEFKSIFKSGRTHLQDALPMTLGQEFSGYASMIDSNINRLTDILKNITLLPIGGTGVGTGLNTSKEYQNLIIKEINKLTGIEFKKAQNNFAAIQNTDSIAALSSILKVLAIGLIKLCNDIRLLNSGPNTGLSEIKLPAVQPGSSIMPGKVNPVMVEMLNMASYQVCGNDITISEASQASQLELNVMMPVIAYNIINSLEILKNGIKAFRVKCISGIIANKEKCREYLEKNPIIATALTPILGYHKTSEIVKEAYLKNKSIKEIVLELKLMKEDELDKILDFKKLIQPNILNTEKDH